MEVEKLGKPVAALCNVGFARDARSAAMVKGCPALRVVLERVPCEATDGESIARGVAEVIGEVVQALTEPLREEEWEEALARAAAWQPGDARGVVYRGGYEEVNRYFYRMGWTDGLPIVPPTPRAVEEMLRGTDLDPDHVVASLPPRGGKATVEKIAINAVMAGALPTHLPVIIAAVEALADPDAWYGTYQVSTGSWAPFVVVNGPVRRDIGLNCGSGALSPGNMANAAIGRAIRLVDRNIGGVRPGIEDMGVFGNPGKYTLVLGENEEESPWEPLHVEQGLEREESAVSVFFPNTYVQAVAMGTDPESLVLTLARNVPAGKRNALTAMLVIPDHARILAQAGWSKQEVVRRVVEAARIPRYRSPYIPPERAEGLSPKELPRREEDWMPAWMDPAQIRLVVTGGPGSFMALWIGSGLMPARWVTKRVRLPKAWGRMVVRYRGMVPRYAG
ncbi:MAG: hypothetical protein N0A24_02730 [Armatimonadetes bacterium]|nr:hypothetical protein [Armatimonadota bacterium]MDW8153129.1 hypothetical protein [Armatimonadota bacterium]